MLQSLRNGHKGTYICNLQHRQTTDLTLYYRCHQACKISELSVFLVKITLVG